jgi:nickel-dependent lactate racemase
MAVLRYGVDSSLELEFPQGTAPIECGTPRGRPLADLAAAVTEALQKPLEYPSLARSTTPGDRVVLALDDGVPQAAQITAAAVLALVDARVEPDGITVLRTQADADAEASDPCRLLPEGIRRRITLFTHDPTSRHDLAYLAATETGDPVLLSRAIHNADLVLPIGCLHAETAAGYYGIHGTVFPTFSDQKTLQRFRCLGSLGAQGNHHKTLVEEVDEVAWLLGINFTIQLIPAAGDFILHVLAGQSEAVRRRGRELYQQAWSWPAPRRASLVVAAIEGDCNQQTWHNLGRALETASALVEEGGAIAVCCDLAAPPGAAVQRLLGARSRHAALRQIGKQRPSDTLPAAQLARALDHGKVYLLSRLDPSLVEELEMIHIAAPEELVRLARQYTSCTLLANAPHTIIAD